MGLLSLDPRRISRFHHSFIELSHAKDSQLTSKKNGKKARIGGNRTKATWLSVWLESALCHCAKHSSANRQVFITRFLVYKLDNFMPGLVTWGVKQMIRGKSEVALDAMIKKTCLIL